MNCKQINLVLEKERMVMNIFFSNIAFLQLREYLVILFKRLEKLQKNFLFACFIENLFHEIKFRAYVPKGSGLSLVIIIM